MSSGNHNMKLQNVALRQNNKVSPTQKKTGSFVIRLTQIKLLVLLVAASLVNSAYAKGPQSVAEVAEPLFDSVVNISTSQAVKGPQGVPLPNVPKGSPFEEFFDDFFNSPNSKNQQRRVRSLGSGFVIDASGIIVTNNHVIEGAEEISASFNDGTKLKVVEILGTDPKTDLALLRVVPKKPLKAVKFGDSTNMRVGDWVMAIGNPFGLGGSLTVGVISAKKRDIKSGPYDEFIQTDASINRGNSGGPLFNMKGEVIGVNTAIISPTGGSIGIGFASPASTVIHVIGQLRKYGETRRGWLGVRIQVLTDEIAESLGLDRPMGALVAGVTPGSPADEAGIVAGDVILRFNSQPIDTMRTLPRIVANSKIGSVVTIEYLRKGKKRKAKVKVGRLIEKKKTEEEPDIDIPSASEMLMGIKMAELNEKLRKRYNKKAKDKGVIIVEVDEDSIAAERNIRAGDMIVEVNQEAVKTLYDVARKVEKARQERKQNALLLLLDTTGNLRFVAIPLSQ